jgi:hypothetical protein
MEGCAGACVQASLNSVGERRACVDPNLKRRAPCHTSATPLLREDVLFQWSKATHCHLYGITRFSTIHQFESPPRLATDNGSCVTTHGTTFLRHGTACSKQVRACNLYARDLLHSWKPRVWHAHALPPDPHTYSPITFIRGTRTQPTVMQGARGYV